MQSTFQILTVTQNQAVVVVSLWYKKSKEKCYLVCSKNMLLHQNLPVGIWDFCNHSTHTDSLSTLSVSDQLQSLLALLLKGSWKVRIERERKRKHQMPNACVPVGPNFTSMHRCEELLIKNNKHTETHNCSINSMMKCWLHS